MSPRDAPFWEGTGGGGMIWLRSTGDGVEEVEGPRCIACWCC